ncbi:MAG: PKD domain-containing protein [Bacteroidales bacterium]|nr:PKD domain-containing protein [Bacteroidales bacterium]
MRRAGLYVAQASALFAVACTPAPSVKADFTTDKDVYEIRDEVIIRNLSSAKGTTIGLCKWEWEGNVSYKNDPGVIVFEEVGEYPIKLTVYAEEGVAPADTCVRIVKVFNNNEPPVAAFDAPASAVQDTPVQFTDRSTDKTGRIVSWLWDIGGVTSTEQNPTVTFISWGSDIEVSLTVTDNYGASSSATKTISVTQSDGHGLQVEWAKPYDSDGYVYWTSPAVTADGSRIYVSSTGYHLVCFDPSGNEKGRYDIGVNGANPYSYANESSPSLNNPSPTPSIDAEGNVYIAVQFYEFPKASTTGQGGIFSIKPDCAGVNWYFNTGTKSTYRFLAPPVFDNYVAICLRENDADLISQNAGVFNRKTGTLLQALNCDQGSLGGMAVSADQTLVYGAARTDAGYKIARGGGGSWSPSTNNDSGRKTNLLNGKGETRGYQPAISSDNLVYVCVSAGSSSQMVCACYDLAAYKAGSSPHELWMTTVNASSGQCGFGPVLDEAGNACFMAGNKIFRLNKTDGSLAWTYSLSGDCIGVAAIDSKGYLYVCDPSANRLLKISSASGQKVSEVEVPHPNSCPTIGPDGSIYVTANKDGVPTLLKIVGTGANKSVAPGTNWSQLGGNPQKTCCAPGTVIE